MKPIVAAMLAAAVYASSTGLAAGSQYDPSESIFVPAPETAITPMDADAVAALGARYTDTVRYWDPSESEFVEVPVAPANATSAIATNDPAAVPLRRMYDPAESTFMMVPAN